MVLVSMNLAIRAFNRTPRRLAVRILSLRRQSRGANPFRVSKDLSERVVFGRAVS